MVSPVKTMGHPQERQSVVVNVLKDTLEPIVRLRTHVLLERMDNLVRTVVASSGQQAAVRVAAWEDIVVRTVRLGFLVVVLSRAVGVLARSTAKMVVSLQEPQESADASAALDGQELHARQLYNVLLVLTVKRVSMAVRLSATQETVTVSAPLGTLDQIVRQLTVHGG
jgi:hypothetical protein